jgi:hypothetical protein
MEWIGFTLCVVFISVCFAFVAHTARKDGENAENGAFEKGGTECREGCETAQSKRAQSREAHYMQNFWNYDGSQQLDWDEEE